MTARTAIVAVAAYLVVLAIGLIQLAVGAAPASAVAAGAGGYAAGLVALVLSWRWAARRAIFPRGGHLEIVTAGGSVLSIWLAVQFAHAAMEHAGDPAAYYRIKVLVTSPVGDHNTAAGLLLVAAVAAAVLTFADRRWWISVGLVAVGLIATLSRGAALVLAAAALASWWLVSRREIAARLSAVAALVVSGVFVLAGVLDASPPAGGVGHDGAILGASVIGRIDLARRGGQIALEHPWLGAGFGSFAQFADDLPPPNHHAHHAPLQAAAEAGWLAAAAVLLLIVVLMRAAWRLPASAVRDVALLGGGAIIAHSQFEILGGLAAYEALVGGLLGLVLARHAGRGERLAGGRLAGPSVPP